MTELRRRITSYLSHRLGDVAIALQQIRGGTAMGVQEGLDEDEASVIKVDILLALLYRSHGRLTPSEASAAANMIELSDNDAATELWRVDGGAAGITKFNATAGLKSTRLSKCVECKGFPWPGWGLSSTTPEDELRLLRLVALPNHLFAGSERHYVAGLMRNVVSTERWGVSTSVPPSAMVALKNGWLPLNGSETDWQINSVGWILGDHLDYVIAIFSTGNPSEAYGIETADAVSQLIVEATASQN